MLKNIKKDNKGFTIIEVLIVLAVAGMIMLVVFLAVPALQRNSRNTRRRADVSVLLGLLNETVANNNGSLPSGTCNGATSGGCWVQDAKLSLYSATSANTKYDYSASARGTVPSSVTAVDVVEVYNYVKCNNNAPTTTNASARGVVALWAVEGTNGGTTPQCMES